MITGIKTELLNAGMRNISPMSSSNPSDEIAKTMSIPIRNPTGRLNGERRIRIKYKRTNTLRKIIVPQNIPSESIEITITLGANNP